MAAHFVFLHSNNLPVVQTDICMCALIYCGCSPNLQKQLFSVVENERVFKRSSSFIMALKFTIDIMNLHRFYVMNQRKGEAERSMLSAIGHCTCCIANEERGHANNHDDSAAKPFVTLDISEIERKENAHRRKPTHAGHRRLLHLHHHHH